MREHYELPPSMHPDNKKRRENPRRRETPALRFDFQKGQRQWEELRTRLLERSSYGEFGKRLAAMVDAYGRRVEGGLGRAADRFDGRIIGDMLRILEQHRVPSKAARATLVLLIGAFASGCISAEHIGETTHGENAHSRESSPEIMHDGQGSGGNEIVVTHPLKEASPLRAQERDSAQTSMEEPVKNEETVEQKRDHALLLDFTEKEPKEAWYHYDDIARKADGREILRAVARHLAEHDPATVLRGASKFAELLPEEEETLLRKACTRLIADDPLSFLQLAYALKKFSWYEEVVRSACGAIETRYPAEVITHAAVLQASPEGRAMLLKNAKDVLEIYPEVVLQNMGGVEGSSPFIQCAAELLSERDPQRLLYYRDNVLQLANGEELLCRAAERILETDPELVWDRLPPTVKGSTTLLLNAGQLLAEKNPRAILFTDDLEARMGYKHILRQAVEQLLIQSPDTVLNNSDRFQALPERDELVRRAGEILVERDKSDCMTVLRYYEKFENIEGGRHVLEGAAEKFLQRCKDGAVQSSWDIGALFGPVQRILGKEKIQETVEMLCESHPAALLSFSSDVRQLSHGDSLLRRAVERAAESDPGAMLSYADLLTQWNDGDQLLQAVLSRLAEDNPVRIFYQHEKIPSAMRERVLRRAMERLAEQEPRAILYAFEEGKLPSIANGEEIVKRAAENLAEEYPDVILFHVEKYSEEIVHRAVDRYMRDRTENFSPLFHCVGKLKDYAWAAPYIRQAAERDPELFINHYPDLLFLPDALQLLDACRERVRVSEAREAMPERTVAVEDFPLRRERFALSDIPSSDIFFSPTFQSVLRDRAGTITYRNASSLALAVGRRCERNGDVSDASIRTAAEEILDATDHIRSRELFGPHTKLILFTHEERGFDNHAILERLCYRHGGTNDVVLASVHGVVMHEGENTNKEHVLEAIRASKGATTVVFSGHGSPENWGFASNQADNQWHDLASDPHFINYKELGDALMASGNITNINLIGDTCNAYDYVQNLFRYLEEHDVREKPAITITAANKNRFGVYDPSVPIGETSAILLRALEQSTERQAPITVDAFFRAESQKSVYNNEDPALFFGPPEQYKGNKGIESPAQKNGERKETELQPRYYLEIGQGVPETTREKSA